MTRLFVLLFMAAALVLAQQDAISGKWAYTMDSPAGSVPVTLDLRVEGGKLTGTVAAGEDRRFKIESGSVDGNSFKLSFKRDRPQGGTMLYEMSGKVEGSSMKGTTVADVDGEKVTQTWEAKKQ